MDTFGKIAIRIIKEQELIIGPIAWEEARKVEGLNIVNQKNGYVEIKNKDSKSVLDNLVSQYEHLFGPASREVCKDAAAKLLADLSPTEIPTSLT